MKILTTFTHKYLKMFLNIFVPSLPEGTELIFQYQNYELEDCKNFGQHDTNYKIPFILKTLESLTENEKILYLDVDIVVLKKDLFTEIKKLEDRDLWIQFDNVQGGVCLGCMIIKNTKAIKDLFKKYLSYDYGYIKNNFGFSLPFFKHLLKTEKINYSVLPIEYYGKQFEVHGIKRPAEIFLYHATFENGITEKYETLKKNFKIKL